MEELEKLKKDIRKNIGLINEDIESLDITSTGEGDRKVKLMELKASYYRMLTDLCPRP